MLLYFKEASLLNLDTRSRWGLVHAYDAGWANSLNDLLSDALRRYLESHSEALAETFILEDVEWGLHGVVD